MIRRHIEEVSRLVRSGRSGQSFNLPGAWTLQVEKTRVRLAPPGVDLGALEPPLYRLEVQPVRGQVDPRAGQRAPDRGRDGITAPPRTAVAWVDGNAVEPPLRYRLCVPGDTVRLVGAPGRRKLSRIFLDRGVPPRLRSLWPVVEDESGIVWVPGVGVAERAKVHEETREALRLHLESLGKDPAAGPPDLVQGQEDH